MIYRSEFCLGAALKSFLREPDEKRFLIGSNGNQSAAGRELGISPRMMCYKMKKAGLEQ